MNEKKLKYILDKIARVDVPPDVSMIAERTSRNFDTVLKIIQPRQTFFTPIRFIAAAAVIAVAFSAGRLSKPVPPMSPSPQTLGYKQAASLYTTVSRNPDSFWQQKAQDAMQPRPYTHPSFTHTEMFNAYKQYLKEKYND
jgi:hypothetical protein